MKQQFIHKIHEKEEKLKQQFGKEIHIKMEDDPEFQEYLHKAVSKLNIQYYQALTKVKEELLQY